MTNALDHLFGEPNLDGTTWYAVSETASGQVGTVAVRDASAQVGHQAKQSVDRNFTLLADSVPDQLQRGYATATPLPDGQSCKETESDRNQQRDFLSPESITYLSHKQSCWQCNSNRDLCSTAYMLCLIADLRMSWREGELI